MHPEINRPTNADTDVIRFLMLHSANTKTQIRVLGTRNDWGLGDYRDSRAMVRAEQLRNEGWSPSERVDFETRVTYKRLKSL